MTWIDWHVFTRRWLTRAERTQELLDDGDRFISLWIAFNGWMKWKFGENSSDRHLIDRVKELVQFKSCFRRLEAEAEFSQNLAKLETYNPVADMRQPDNDRQAKSYEGTFSSLIEVIYQVRCNLFHGRKEVSADERDFQLVSLSYRLLLPLFKEYLRTEGN